MEQRLKYPIVTVGSVINALLFLYKRADYQWFVKMFGSDATYLWGRFAKSNDNPIRFYDELDDADKNKVLFAIYKYIKETS